MSKDQSMTCPVCHTEMPMAMFFTNEEARRTFTRLAVLSIPLGARVMRYLTLFNPPKTRLTMGKQLKLIEQLLPDLERCAVEVAGQDWQAPLELWNLAFEKLFAVANEGRLTLPLSGHNYLYSTIRDQANKVATKAEAKAEHDKRHTPQRGAVQVNGGATSIGAALGHKDPALADLEQRTSQAAKPSQAVLDHIARIKGMGAK